jgi:glycosyltransferase involved in cell wall biosynthesis
VLPTYSENFGMSIAEALASGTPALVSKGAPWSGLEARRAGRWIDIGVDPLVAGLEDLLQREPRELRDMGINGRTWMTEAYSWRTIGQRMAELYHWLARGSAGVPSFVITS